MTITIDAYGHRSDQAGYKKKVLRPAEFVEVAGKTYLRYTTKDKCPIWRFNAEEGTLLWAIGSWDDKETLTYETDTNDSIEISPDDID